MGYLVKNASFIIKAAEEEKKKKKKKRSPRGTSSDTSFAMGQLMPSGRAAFVAGRSPAEQNEAAANSFKMLGGSALGALLGAGLGVGGMHLLNKGSNDTRDVAMKKLLLGGLAGSALGGITGGMTTFKKMLKNRGLDSDLKLRHFLSSAARTEALLGGDEESQRKAFKRAVTRKLGWNLPGHMLIGAASGLTGGTAGALAAPLMTASDLAASRLQRAANPEDYEFEDDEYED